jgi:hypothetical protein
MLLYALPPRAAAAFRLVALALIALAVAKAHHPPGTSGRGLAVSVLLAAAMVSWLIWTARPHGERLTLELYVMAVAGGVLIEASSQGAASVFVFVAVVAAGMRVELVRAAPLVIAGALAIGVADLIYRGSALGLLAYALGIVACLLAASTARQRVGRAEQTELLLAQTQRTMRSSFAPRALRSRRGLPARSTTCWRIRWPD